MAHSHDRSLVQQLGIETDHKSLEHDQAIIWLLATTVPLDANHQQTLHNEGIKTLRISDDYKHVKSAPAQMDTI
jgi:hypothetical protein